MSDNCIYVDEGETYELAETTLRTARKEWSCCECGDPINVGDRYEDFRGLYDGVWDSHRTCARCATVADDFFRGRIFEFMAEYFMEAHGFDYRDGIPADFTPCGEVQA